MGRETKPSAVTFDLWATVLESPRVGSRARHQRRVSALLEALHASGERVERGAIDRLMQAEWSRYNQVWREEMRTLQNDERLAWMVSTLDCAPLPAALSVSVCEAFDHSLWEGPPGLVEGAAEVIEALANAGVRLGVISDTSFSTGATLRRLLEREGILRHFGALTFSDEVGRSKPHASLFEQTLTQLGVRAADAAHIGDNEHTDVHGARSAGMLAVRFVGGLHGTEATESAADHVVSRFDELLPLILL